MFIHSSDSQPMGGEPPSVPGILTAGSAQLIGSTLVFNSRGKWFKSQWARKNFALPLLSRNLRIAINPIINPWLCKVIVSCSKHERFPVKSHHLFTNGLFIIKKMKMRRSFCQINGSSKVCAQKGDRVSKNDKSCHIL